VRTKDPRDGAVLRPRQWCCSLPLLLLDLLRVARTPLLQVAQPAHTAKLAHVHGRLQRLPVLAAVVRLPDRCAHTPLLRRWHPRHRDPNQSATHATHPLQWDPARGDVPQTGSEYTGACGEFVPQTGSEYTGACGGAAPEFHVPALVPPAPESGVEFRHARYAVKCHSQMYPYRIPSTLHFLMTSAFWLHLRVVSLLSIHMYTPAIDSFVSQLSWRRRKAPAAARRRAAQHGLRDSESVRIALRLSSESQVFRQSIRFVPELPRIP
jgi:hypothetical protein